MGLGSQLQTMRAARPLVHNIANYVSMNVMANVLLAAGASPAMIHAREEAAEFAAIAAALTVNIGTLSAPWLEAMTQAAEAATAAGRPWVFDPVAAGATAYRADAARALLQRRPAIIRGNASEIIALAGQAAAAPGAACVDAVDPVAAAEDAARALAQRQGAVVIATGKIDFLTDGQRAARIANGHPTMPLVTALGCSLTGIVAAFAAGGADPFDASLAALAYFGLAGERAGAVSSGPGSFAVAFLDALYQIDAEALDAGARVERL